MKARTSTERCRQVQCLLNFSDAFKIAPIALFSASLYMKDAHLKYTSASRNLPVLLHIIIISLNLYCISLFTFLDDKSDVHMQQCLLHELFELKD